MKIAKYIADLLFEYECIVIPGFGGFITKETPSKIHPVQNHFVPPSKEIVFNVHLKTNDGLLVNHIARQENLTYIEARSAVERFVKKCLIELTNGKQIRFRKVGTIYMDKEKNILFEPDKTQNYLADSFGLKGFVSPQIKRTIVRPTVKSNKTATQKNRSPKETVKREAKKKVIQGPKYVNINVSFMLIVLAIATLVYLKPNWVKQQYQTYASSVPFFYSSPNEYIAHNANKSPMLSVITLVDKLNSPEAPPQKVKKDTTKKAKTGQKSTGKPSQGENTKTKQKQTPKPDPEKKTDEAEKQKSSHQPDPISTAPKSDSYKHFIIAGVFRDKTNAENFTKELKAKGHNAMIVDQSTSGLYRVCFDAFASKTEADKKLAAIRKEEESLAWLLSI